MKLKDLTGQRFGNWLVLHRDLSSKWSPQDGAVWVCECQCGNSVQQSVRSGPLLRGLSRSCGCLRPRLRPYEALYRKMKRDNTGRLRTIDFQLTYEEFLEFTQESKCFYCWAPLHWQTYAVTGYGYNLDRKDNTQGYTKENCVACCTRCNMGKRDTFSFEEWYGMTAYFRMLFK